METASLKNGDGEEYGAVSESFDQDEDCILNDRQQLIQRTDNDLISNFKARLNLVKANVGTGIQAMPYAFLHSGLAVGPVFLALIGAVAVHCMHLLIRCSHEVCRLSGEQTVDYATNAHKAFTYGRPATRKLAPFMKYSTNVFLMGAQIGFCIVYYKYVAQNLKQLFDVWYGGDEMSATMYMLILLPFFTILGCMRSIRWITPLSTISNILIVVGFSIIFYYLFTDIPPLSSRPAAADITMLPVFFGTAVFAFEGIGCILPIENKMVNPEAMFGRCGVINSSMGIVVSAYIIVGFFGYLKYGADVINGQVIILNLPPHETLAQVGKLVMAVAIYLSYALQFYVPIEMLTEVRSRNRWSQYYTAMEFAVRLITTLLIFGLAVAIPHIGVIISLLGAICGSFIALMYPPLMDTVLFPQQPTYIHVKNIAIVILGLIGFITGSYISIKEIITTF